MKILILGAGFMQLNAIRKAKEKGHKIIVSDYLTDAPGKKAADFSEMTSTFDVEGNIKVAKKYEIDGIFTIGTDQPVLTAARVAEALNLPKMIGSETALKATNKKYMKQVFVENNISCSRYLLVNKEELSSSRVLLDKLSYLNFPIVIKPLDSQGQRGIFKLYGPDENIIDFMRQTFFFTNKDEIIVEEFCAGDEVTISAWVENYHSYILMITDRPLLNVEPHLGIPDGHIFPSRYTSSHYQIIQELIKKIVTVFDIVSGPIYVQMIIAENRIEVVEVACRIGGGHEEELIPLVTGIDPVDMLIEKTIDNKIDTSKLEKYELLNNTRQAMVKFVIARPGKVKCVGNIQEVKTMPGVINAGFYNPNLKEVKELINSTRRVGYLLVEGETREELMQNTRNAYPKMEILDELNNNMVYLK